MDKYTEFSQGMKTKFPRMFQQPFGGFDVGEGWWPILVALCDNIQQHIDHREQSREYLLDFSPDDRPIPDKVPPVVVHQIKEKFGGLRFYYSGGDDYIRGLVHMAESWASKTCETCGNPGKLRGGGWLHTACEEHVRNQHET